MTTRRDFIRRSAVAATGVALYPGSILQPAKQLSIQLYTLRNEIADLPGVLKGIQKAGYTNVELYGYEKRSFFGRTVKEFAALLKEHQLLAPGGHYGLSDMLYAPSYNWDSWKYLVEDANLLGHRYIVIPWLDEDKRTTDDFKRVAERLNTGGELSKAAGLQTGYHNHDFEFAIQNGKTGYELLLENTDPILVTFEMDLYWVTYAGHDPLQWFAKHPGRFSLWHVKDMEAANPGTPKGQTCEVGAGIIDWKKIFSAKETAGVRYAFVEQEQYRRPVLECIRSSADYIKRNALYPPGK